MKQTISRRTNGNSAPLSFAQQRLWFLNQLEPDNPVYNVYRAWRLSGRLNVEALQRAVDTIVARHQMLRSTFEVVDGQPIQVTTAALTIPLEIVDLERFSPADREAKSAEYTLREARLPFDLVQGPLFRIKLLRLAEKEHVLILSLHHIVTDGWSMGVFHRELASLYEAFIAGRPSPLPDLPIQYSDYTLWQREWLQGDVLEEQLSYWKRQLADLPVTELPTDRSRPPVQSHQGAREIFRLSRALTAQLKVFSQRERASLYMTLLAAVKVLLHRYSCQDDIVVGTPIANRIRTELEPLIGMLVNTLTLRTDLSGDPTFRKLLGRVRDVALAAYGHQDLPFEKLVEELQAERDMSRNPLFQVSFTLQNTPAQALGLSGIDTVPFTLGSVSPFNAGNGTAKFDLTVSMIETEGSLAGMLEYSTDLFDRTTILRMVGHLQILLGGIVANADRRLSELPLLTSAEKRQLLLEWNDTKRDYPKDKCIHDLFAEQVERTPDVVAVVFKDQRLTYRELNRRANQLAHYLRKQGVKAESLVGICVERSLDMIIGLLGILKAGGAYVPLDPACPRERLTLMLEDMQAPVLLTHQQLLDSFQPSDLNPQPSFSPLPKVICLDTDWEAIAREKEDNPVSTSTADNLAYVIYTSGSTGTPKGVMIEHRQIVSYIQAIDDRCRIKSDASFALVQPVSFDASKTSVFGSLTSGGVLHLIAEDKASDPASLASYFTRFPMSFLKITPSHLATLETSFDIEKLLPSESLMLGGEASNSDWVKRVESKAPGLTILNHYGPTESTIGVATYEVKGPVVPTASNTLPIGRPLSNRQIYLLDQHLNLVPVGVPGELYIGGAGVARGYLNRPELTAEKFIPNLFTDLPGERLYRTGDRARYLLDGNIEFIGRTDDQVKIRGYRIELGEIESVLRQHPDVRETAVLARENSDGQKQLTAYIVPDPRRSPTVTGKLRYQLPNGAAVAQLNKNETDYIYEEIFERQAYLRHGITVKDGDCIFDVGANIGLFTVFANRIARGLRVYSFEPNPTVFEILSANAAIYGSDVRLFNCGLSDQAKTAEFTFFPGFSLLSGFYADAQKEKEVVKTFMINQKKAGVAEMAELVDQADAILEQRFEPQSFSAELRTLSDVIERESIESIDLLKINVEKSELDVLKGIKDADWRKIEQIVLEVDVKENLPDITSLLEKYGFEFVIDRELLLAGTPLCYVYAVRPSEERSLIREQQKGAHIRSIAVLRETLLSTSEIREFLGKKIPDYMLPSVFMFLDVLPLTPNGKVDREALPVPDQTRPELEQTFVAPRTDTEGVLAGIWREVLKLERVGVHDDFFELGGHSLVATQVISRVRDALQVELPLYTLFEHATVAGLATQITQTRSSKTVPEGLADALDHVKSLSDEAADRLLAHQYGKVKL